MGRLQVVERAGPEPYLKTLEAQTNLLEAKIQDESLPDYLILVEHEHVYTAGRSAPFGNSVSVHGQEIPWHEVGRGGKATYHGPSQLVAYPIFNLEGHGKDVHVFLRKLEEAGIATLAEYGLEAEVRAGLTGIWLRNLNSEWKKIASIGIGVKRWVSYHGIAINLDPDLSFFKQISPCDQSGEVMTSIAEQLRERGQPVPEMDDLKDRLVANLARVFNLEVEPRLQAKPLAERSRPDWLKVKAGGSPEFLETNGVVRKLNLVTVCEEARCPNIGECWSHHTATFMIMGELCTRRCSFCAVRDGTLESLNPLDPLEPYKVAKAIAELGLKHVVITSVNRDDLADMGAEHFNKTVQQIRQHNPQTDVELLTPDMRGRRELVETILSGGGVKVYNHNLETVPRLYRTVRPGASFRRSLDILRWVKEIRPEVKTKSGIMVGLGEEREEVLEVMSALREVGVDILTIGQYLQPTEKQLPIQRYVTPEEFEDYRIAGEAKGFSFVESAPLVRSSYHAWRHV